MAKEIEKAKRNQPTRREVEMAQAQGELAKARASIEKWGYLGRTLQWGFSIAALSLPLLALRSVIEPLAGRTTEVNANIIISVSLVVSITLAGAAMFKIFSQRTEMKRMRKRIEELERGRLGP